MLFLVKSFLIVCCCICFLRCCYHSWYRYRHRGNFANFSYIFSTYRSEKQNAAKSSITEELFVGGHIIRDSADIVRGRSVRAMISGGRGRPFGIFFGFYKTRYILLSDSANCTVLSRQAKLVVNITPIYMSPKQLMLTK